MMKLWFWTILDYSILAEGSTFRILTAKKISEILKNSFVTERSFLLLVLEKAFSNQYHTIFKTVLIFSYTLQPV